jgi:hypothetical protein
MVLWFLLDLSVKTALFAVAAELLLRLVDARDTILRHTAWVAVLAGMLVLPLSLLLPGLPLRLSFVSSPAEVATAAPPTARNLPCDAELWQKLTTQRQVTASIAPP